MVVITKLLRWLDTSTRQYKIRQNTEAWNLAHQIAQAGVIEAQKYFSSEQGQEKRAYVEGLVASYISRVTSGHIAMSQNDIQAIVTQAYEYTKVSFSPTRWMEITPVTEQRGNVVKEKDPETKSKKELNQINNSE